MNETCRCDGEPLNGSDHCPCCYCEQYEERCEWEVPFDSRPLETETDVTLEW